MMTVDMTQLHRLAPEDAAMISTFTSTNLDNSTTVHRVSAQLAGCPAVCVVPLTAEHSSGAASSALICCC